MVIGVIGGAVCLWYKYRRMQRAARGRGHPASRAQDLPPWSTGVPPAPQYPAYWPQPAFEYAPPSARAAAPSRFTEVYEVADAPRRTVVQATGPNVVPSAASYAATAPPLLPAV
jgi:hypothetical protein